MCKEEELSGKIILKVFEKRKRTDEGTLIKIMYEGDGREFKSLWSKAD